MDRLGDFFTGIEVGSTVTKVYTDDKVVRYSTPGKLRSAIVVFDKTKEWPLPPGEYRLNVLAPTHRSGGRKSRWEKHRNPTPSSGRDMFKARALPSRRVVMNVQNRQRVEKEIATAIINAAIAKGYTFKVDNGGDDDEVISTTTLDETLKAMFATDEEHLYIVGPNGKNIGWVFFVYGNDGWDVVNDYTTNLDALGIMTEAETISDKYQ